MSQRRNDACACGSGLKYKQCCEKKPTRKQWWRYAGIGAFTLLIAVGFVTGIIEWANREPGPPGEAPPGKVWSEEHGHWHDATPQPLGAAPAGKVWSAEHGHWHDAPAGVASSPPPPGPPPPGKVWSAEHGHWHDAAGTGDNAVDEDALPPLDGTETSPAPVTPSP